jgi:hypothetical protein
MRIDGFCKHFRKKTKSDYSLRRVSVRPSLHMEHLGSHRAVFHDILYLTIFRKSVEKIEVLLKSDKNNGYFTYIRNVIIAHAFMLFLLLVLRVRNVTDKSCRKNQTHIYDQ